MSDKNTKNGFHLTVEITEDDIESYMYNYACYSEGMDLAFEIARREGEVKVNLWNKNAPQIKGLLLNEFIKQNV